MCDSKQVKYGVGGSADRHIGCESVQHVLLGEDIERTDILLYKLNSALAGLLCKSAACGVYSRLGSGGRESKTHSLGQAVHGVCGVHAGAASAGGACVIFEILDNIVADLAVGILTDSLVDLRIAYALALYAAGVHRTAAAEDSREVHSCRCKHHSGYYLVAVRNEYNAVQRVSGQHYLDGVSDELSGSEGISHALVVHCETVAYADGEELKRNAARISDTVLYCAGDLVQVHMSGDVIAGSTDNRDERSVHFAVSYAQSLEYRSVRSFLYSFFNKITSHDFSFPPGFRVTKFICRNGGALRLRLCLRHYRGSKSRSRYF